MGKKLPYGFGEKIGEADLCGHKAAKNIKTAKNPGKT